MNDGLSALEERPSTKLAIVGGVCTGKTVLLNSYQQHRGEDPRFAFVEEAARSFFRDAPRVVGRAPNQQSLENARKIQALVLENEIRAQQTGAEFILCDSSVLTAVMYMLGYGETKKAEALLSAVEFWLPTYDHFLLLDPADVPYKNDDVRYEGVGHRERTHDAYIRFFSQKQISYDVLCGTVRERIAGVDRVLRVREIN